MSYGSGIDQSDEPSDRDKSRDPSPDPAPPDPVPGGPGRAWTAVQVSRPADLLAAAQAAGAETLAAGRSASLQEPRIEPASSRSGLPTSVGTAGDPAAGDGVTEPESRAEDAAAEDAAADDAVTDMATEGAMPGSRLPGAAELAAAVASADPGMLGRTDGPERAGDRAADPDDASHGKPRGRKAKKAAKKAAEALRSAAKKADREASAEERKGRRKRRNGPPAEAAVTAAPAHAVSPTRKRLDSATYERELARLYIELVKLQEWVKAQGLKVVVIFEGRDAAGKGGVIKRIMEPLNPRYARVVALAAPTERERTQWYFQRYVAHLPAAGEMVLFDRSWYNRAGVERVMGFCTDEEYREFARTAPEFERMLVRSGIVVVKYWFSVSDEEQERRFRARIGDPTKRWKLSPMDLQSRARWVEYSRAKDEMFTFADIKQAPWYVVPSDDKKRARLNCIAHLLSLIPYEDLTPEQIVLPPRQDSSGYVRPPITDQTFVPERY